jgi:hypothetical protein
MGLVPGLDERVEGLMTAVRLDSAEQLSSWLAIVQAACPADQPERSVGDFAAALRGAAGSWPSTSVNYFIETLEAQAAGVRPVTDLVRTLQQDPNTYWALYAQLYPAAPAAAAAPVDRFGWLAERQVLRLAAGWGDQWRDYLGQQLDYRWGTGWEATYGTEGSQGYLDALIEEWLPQQEVVQAAAEPEEPDEPIEFSPAELDEIAADAIREAIESIPGADQLAAESVAEMTAAVRAELTGSEL